MEDDIQLTNEENQRVFQTFQTSMLKEIREGEEEFSMYTKKAFELASQCHEKLTGPFVLAKLDGWDLTDPVALSVVYVAKIIYQDYYNES